ncbi:hypothetical protein BCV70DRAFT_203159 [Testicularia cyperi]|uniref:Adhesin domain-containing protein n=1 Tax=Testicularia cyperi TaxID=1882483 RepID=A0A317XF78_9BASI|nr:hypothetical protein BCV70DRAFT_203159 [Testicularia cyperi]
MSSSRHTQDEQPLLLNQTHDETDHRFAIDDELAEQQNDSDNSSPKYPPLPPSYDDTLRFDAQSRSRWNPASWFTISRTTKEHIQACFPRTSSGELLTFSSAFSACYGGVMRCWPSNRFSQASVFIVLLWLLVLFTGPSLYSNEDLGNGLHQNWDYSNIPTGKPAPLHEDGHVVEEAKWQWHGCASLKGTSRVQCRETSSILLNPFKAKDSFASTESIFVDVDPLRSDRPEPAGSVPGTISVVHATDAVPPAEKDLVKVEITARYDEAYKFLFERSLVAKMNRGIFDEGVEILTYAKAVSIEESPLVFDLKIVIPPHLNIPNLSIDAGASNLDILTPPAVQRRGSRRQVARVRRAASTAPGFYFGKMHARTQVGNLQTSSIRALADIHLTTTAGALRVNGKLEAQSVELKTLNGQLTVDPGSSLEAAYDLTLQTQNGHIEIGEGSNIRATTIRSESLNGGILAKSAIFHANHTLTLRTSTGRIEADVGVEKPSMARLDAPGLGKSDLVTVEAHSQTGSVELDFVEHAPSVPLRCRATSEIAKVSLLLHEEFEGRWELLGATHSRYRGPGTNDGTQGPRGVRRFVVDQDDFGWINRNTKGRLWWDRDGKDGQVPQKAVAIVSTQIGLAVLTFK